MEKYSITFTYNGKTYKYTQEAKSEEEAKYMFYGVVFRKGWLQTLVNIISCEVIKCDSKDNDVDFLKDIFHIK